MLVTREADVEFERYAAQREGRTDYKLLARGEVGSRDNYEMTIVKWSEEGTYSPRHRHNFDQFRYPLNLDLNYSPNLDVPSGKLGYFAEGGYYGPQRIQGHCLALMIQFAGPSGYGFMNNPEGREGSHQMQKIGRFEKGIYRYEDENGVTHNQDGFEAVWEYVNGAKINYVKPRYKEPVVIDPDAYEWRPVHGAAGVSLKPLGLFNERGTAANLYRLEPGAVLAVAAEANPRLFFTTAGGVELEGSDLGLYGTVALARDESVSLVGGREGAQVLRFDMPDFSD
jgi:hypothetical protein